MHGMGELRVSILVWTARKSIILSERSKCAYSKVTGHLFSPFVERSTHPAKGSRAAALTCLS